MSWGLPDESWRDAEEREVVVYELDNPEVGRLVDARGEVVLVVRQRATVQFGFQGGRMEFVEVIHPTQGTARVPATAVRHMAARGWSRTDATAAPPNPVTPPDLVATEPPAAQVPTTGQ